MMKNSDKIVKYWPVAANILIAGMCVEYFIGANLLISYTCPIFGYSVVAILLIYFLSTERHFCEWHRALIANMSFAIISEALQLYGIEIPEMFYFLSWSTAITILFLCFQTIVKKRQI